MTIPIFDFNLCDHRQVVNVATRLLLTKPSGIKFGVTSNPRDRRSKYGRSYDAMFLLAKTQASTAKRCERRLVRNFTDIDNEHPGGNGPIKARRPTWVYMVARYGGGVGALSDTISPWTSELVLAAREMAEGSPGAALTTRASRRRTYERRVAVGKYEFAFNRRARSVRVRTGPVRFKRISMLEFLELLSGRGLVLSRPRVT